MQAIQAIAKDIYWIGASDRRLALFENIHPLPEGMSYNSYLIMDEKVALLDTVDHAVESQFFENLDAALAGRAIDYLVVNHAEPDHGASIRALCSRYPGMTVVGTEMTRRLLQQFNHFDAELNYKAVAEGEELSLGAHTLRFYTAPMVHWPEVMFSYETSEKILFSADAFGSFKALDGVIFNDEVDFEGEYLAEARRYYTNIVGKYGPQVQAALKKLADVELKMIAPLHGLVWRTDLGYFLDKYSRWSSYTPEEDGVFIAYGSMYGHTEQAAAVLANMLALRGVKNVHMMDVSKTHHSYFVANAFRYSHLVLAAPTYNMGLFEPMHTAVHDMAALNLQNRKVGVIGNGSWAPASHTHLQKMLGEMKGMELVAEPVVLRSALNAETLPALEALADKLAASVKAGA